MSEIITKDNVLSTVEHSALAAEITDEVKAQLPKEKARVERQMRQTAKEVAAGIVPTSGEGRGQAVASIPPLVYMRWQQEYPGCWRDKGFVEEFLFDNPQCRLPGYKPRPKRMFFHMKNGSAKIGNPGGDLYHERKAKVAQAIAAQSQAFAV